MLTVTSELKQNKVYTKTNNNIAISSFLSLQISNINSILNISLTESPGHMDEFDLSLLSAEDR